MAGVEDVVRLQAAPLPFGLRLDERVSPLPQHLRPVGGARVEAGERGRGLVGHARRVGLGVPLLERHPHRTHLGGRDGVAVHLGEEVVSGVPGLELPAMGPEHPGVRRAVQVLDLVVQPVRCLVVDRVRVRWEEVAVAAVLVLVDEQLRRVLPQQAEPARDLGLRTDQTVAVHVERVGVVAPVVCPSVGVLDRDQADDRMREDRARHAVGAVGEPVQQRDDGVPAGRLVAVDVGRDPQDRRRTTDDRARLRGRGRGVAQPVQVPPDRRQPVQRARVADERVAQRAALPGVRVHAGHHPVAGAIGHPPVAADLLIGRLLLAQGEAEHAARARHLATEVRFRRGRVTAAVGAERPARRTGRRHVGEAESDHAGGSDSG